MKQQTKAPSPSIPVKEDENLNSILKLKKNSIDCTEDDSAEIKSYFRDNWLTGNKKREDLFYQLYDNFPLEFNEVWEELDKAPTDMPPAPPLPVKEELLDISKGIWKNGTDTASKEWMQIFANGKIIAEVKPLNRVGQRQSGDFQKEAANAKAICTAVNGSYGKNLDPAKYEQVVRALEDLCKEIHLGKLNIRKDFSLINAHAQATKAIYNAKTIKP